MSNKPCLWFLEDTIGNRKTNEPSNVGFVNSDCLAEIGIAYFVAIRNGTGYFELIYRLKTKIVIVLW
jgi:hypothetical protein